MEQMYVCMVLFLFLLAAFDLWVGVSNDAVNFLNSAIGSRAATFRTLVLIASVGVLMGCVLSNGMMDIARHGIFTPQYFSFHDVMLIFLAVMVTDVVLLDLFNTFGMPTSTTVSMVFELLGASFAFVMVKMAGGTMALGVGDYLNTSKALEVIMGIFLSVPIAFIVGSLVQYVTRLIFSFNLRCGWSGKFGLFGGVALTAIVYFMLFKGLKQLSIMNGDVKAFLHENTLMLLGCVLVVATVLMQVLHALRVNVLRVVVLCGTFALATAFAGNDLVNFIGVPLAGWSSYCDFSANAGGLADEAFMMNSLQESARTPFGFLLAAGVMMVLALATSKKARRVVQTEVGLARKSEGDEMFGSSRVARSLVRWGNSVGRFVTNHTPESVQRYVDSRFRIPENYDDQGAAYDLLRASVNLVVASLLIALGTSLKLPLSTTFVTFMVAMGTSLSDRAWSRESAVFRITGVLTVIGGWFITAGVAFSACFFVGMAMQFGGIVAVVVLVVAAIWSIVHSQLRFARREKSEERDGDLLFRQMTTCHDRTAIPQMLSRHMDVSTAERLRTYSTLLSDMTDGLLNENLSPLRHTLRTLERSKRDLKNLRRRETICLRRMTPDVGVRLTTHFHLLHNALRQLHYGLLRMAEPAAEHVDNHFTPIDELHAERLASMRSRLCALIEQAAANLHAGRTSDNATVAENCREMQHELARMEHDVTRDIQATDLNLTAVTLLLHLVQEMQQLCVQLRLLLRASCHYHELMPTVASTPCHDEV